METVLSLLRPEELAPRIRERTGAPEDEIAATLRAWITEVPPALETILPHLRPWSRVLEVGAGLGLLSRVLAVAGHEVVAVEPVAEPYGFFPAARAAIAEVAREAGLPPVRTIATTAEELPAANLGTFDLVFSVHVFEHVADPDAAFAGMLSAVGEGGEMGHLCPNYAVPYDPHFGVPVWSRRPGWTARLYRRRIARDPALWDGLSFVTHDDIVRLAARHDCAVYFAPGLLRKALRRIDHDGEFATRHNRGLVGTAKGLLEKMGLVDALRWVPPRWATPMCFVVFRNPPRTG